MEIASKHFGVIELDEKYIYEFPKGLYGLEEFVRFGLIIPDEKLPFAYLQSVDTSDICLLVANPFVLYRDYEFDLPDQDLEGLKNPAPETISVWVTVSIPNALENATINLLAPLVINTEKRIGAQIILGSTSYQTKVPFFPVKKEGA